MYSGIFVCIAETIESIIFCSIFSPLSPKQNRKRIPKWSPKGDIFYFFDISFGKRNSHVFQLRESRILPELWRPCFGAHSPHFSQISRIPPRFFETCSPVCPLHSFYGWSPRLEQDSQARYLIPGPQQFPVPRLPHHFGGRSQQDCQAHLRLCEYGLWWYYGWDCDPQVP